MELSDIRTYKELRRYKKRVSAKKRYHKKKELGVCPRCGGIPIKGQLLCCSCSEKRRVNSKRFYQNHKEDERKRLKEQKENRIKNGKCEKCGGLRDVEEFKNCINCRTKTHRPKGEPYYQGGDYGHFSANSTE